MTPVSLTETQHKKTDGLAAILEVLNSGTATSRYPLIQWECGTAARIYEISKKIRANRAKFVEVAEEGCRLVYSISVNLGDHQIDPNLRFTLMKLLGALESIQTLVEKCAARSTIKAVLHVFDIDEISEFNEQRRNLERCIGLCGRGRISSQSSMEQTVVSLAQRRIRTGPGSRDNAIFDGANGIVMGAGNQQDLFA
ncbi:hypothetical protein JOM56_006272 [Amanita muscaria]